MAKADLLAELLAVGLHPREVPGWRDRGGALFKPQGVLLHHTGGAYAAPQKPVRPSLGVVTNGRPDVPPPLCNVYIDRMGIPWLVAAKRANHAGKCSSFALDEVRKGVVTQSTQSAAFRRLRDDDNGNRYLYGIEVEHCGGQRERWSSEVIHATCQVAAALCMLHGWNEGHVTLHRNITARKVDPIGSIDWWSDIAKIIKEHQ